MNGRQLEVRIDQASVGILSENMGIWSFRYTQSWIDDGYALAPGLPLQTDDLVDTGSSRPVQWFFDNLLPEEAARELLLRTAPAQTMRIDAWYLLSVFGAESAGAISLLPPGTQLPDGGLKPLPDVELEERIQAMPLQSLGTNAPKKMSMAGAQEKLLVVVGEDRSLFEPIGTTPSTHLLKPNVASEHYPCSAVNEWFCAVLGGRLGLDVPEVELRFVPSPVYLIKRFDRTLDVQPVRRLHALDAAQLLSLSSGAKYAQSGVASLKDISTRTRGEYATRMALFRWTLFNILIGNSDAHLKNISLFASKAGYVLAPHYDLVSTAAWSTRGYIGQHHAGWPHIGMSFPIADATTYAELTRPQLLVFAAELGLAKSTAERELKRMTGRILETSKGLLEEFENRSDVPVTLKAAQVRMLRTIVYICITEMAKKLA